MKKLVVSMNVTLDGFMAGPNCDLTWHFARWTIDMAEHLCEQLNNADTILLGRITYNVMARYWPYVAASVSIAREDIAFAEMMNSYKKVVFSKTMSHSEVVSKGWGNSSLAVNDVAKEIRRLKNLKNSPNKDLIVYGSCRLVNSLVEAGLVDEYQLWVHPVILGNGKPLFGNNGSSLLKDNLHLFKSRTFSSGVVVLYYHTKIFSRGNL
ncbi:MAG: dihydrofolate reductase family protein [Ginsengibacter sp.]